MVPEGVHTPVAGLGATGLHSEAAEVHARPTATTAIPTPEGRWTPPSRRLHPVTTILSVLTVMILPGLRGLIDHERRMLVEDCDAASRLLLATVDGEPVGTMRLTLGKDGPLSDEFEETFGLGGWTAHAVPAEQVMV
jgi:hypothetical protein